MKFQTAQFRKPCSIPGCGRFSGGPLNLLHCRYHLQRKARHGSHWCLTYAASELKPYLQSAAGWIKANRDQPQIAMAIDWLRGLLKGSGRAELAHRIKGRPARQRARFAFARLHEAGIEPERLLRIYLAVCTLIEDDRDSHRVEEFRVVQVAKAVHRLASGTHQHWEFPLPNGTTTPLSRHTYPKSAGMVLRVMGREIEECCRAVADENLEEIRKLKRELFGPHPSQSPDFIPGSQRERQARSKSR